jgi:pyruvate/2-oxoglutarate dehydrogenase complex dihydrolipoamide acyltransferase (E2) component
MTKVVALRMPKLTMAATDAAFVQWLVADGEEVVAQQPLYAIATDKAESEIPSPADGVLRHGKAATDEVYPVGTMLGAIEVSDAARIETG